MSLTKVQLSIVRSIKGKLQGFLTLKKKDEYNTDKIIERTLNKINSLIVTYELSGETDLLYEVYYLLIRLRKNELAWKFAKKHDLLSRINN